MPSTKPKAEPKAPHWFETAQLVKIEQNWQCARCLGAHGHPHPVTGTRVFLRVSPDRRPLEALCQVCDPPPVPAAAAPTTQAPLFFGLEERSELPPDKETE